VHIILRKPSNALRKTSHAGRHDRQSETDAQRLLYCGYRTLHS